MTKLIAVLLFFISFAAVFAHEECCTGSCWAHGCCPGMKKCNSSGSYSPEHMPGSGVVYCGESEECHATAFDRAENLADQDANNKCKRPAYRYTNYRNSKTTYAYAYPSPKTAYFADAYYRCTIE